MNTFILRWNPNISSYKMETHLEVISHVRKMEFPNKFDWSIYDWHKAKDGDMVILLQVGTDDDGIAMIGKIVGEPVADESWRKDGSKVHYIYIEIFDAFNPAEQKEFRAENFENEFDKIKWHKGHSGELIDQAIANRLFDKIEPIIQGTGDKQCDMLRLFMQYGWNIPFID